MAERELCKSCQHQNTCEDVYRRLGHSQAPPVTSKVIIAFVLPLLTFIVVLALADGVFKHPDPSPAMVLIHCIAALGAAVGVAAVGARYLRTHHHGQREIRHEP